MIGLLDTPRTPLVVGAALATITLGSTLIVEDGPILCPFRRATGGFCPGCGGTRATQALARGDLATAWQLHPWIVLLAVQAILIATFLLFSHPASMALSRLREFALPVVLANSFVGVGLWVLRMAAGQIPVPFG